MKNTLKCKPHGPIIDFTFAPVKKIAVFASGTGSNAQKIIDYFRYSDKARVNLIVCNKAGAGAVQIAAHEHIACLLVTKEKFFGSSSCITELKEHGIDIIVLAGFLWKIPSVLIKEYPGRIINIHPALLPKYGGKGMYGHHVHEAVLAAKEPESGITIHYVDEVYDRGAIIYQTTCPVLENDTPSSLALRIQKLEHEYYPKVIENILARRVK